MSRVFLISLGLVAAMGLAAGVGFGYQNNHSRYIVAEEIIALDLLNVK